jgi:hypothetical protein
MGQGRRGHRSSDRNGAERIGGYSFKLIPSEAENQKPFREGEAHLFSGAHKVQVGDQSEGGPDAWRSSDFLLDLWGGGVYYTGITGVVLQKAQNMGHSWLDIFESKAFAATIAATMAFVSFAPFHGWRAAVPALLTAAAYFAIFRSE